MNSEQAAKRIFMLRQAIKDMKEEEEALSRQFFGKRDQDTYEEGAFKVVVGPNARFDAGLAAKAHKEGTISDEDWEKMLETKPSGTKAKDVLAPVVYRSLQKPADYNKVTITLPDAEG